MKTDPTVSLHEILCKVKLSQDFFPHKAIADRSAHLLSARLCIPMYLEITHRKEQEFHCVGTLILSFVAALFGLEGQQQYVFVCLDFKVYPSTE